MRIANIARVLLVFFGFILSILFLTSKTSAQTPLEEKVLFYSNSSATGTGSEEIMIMDPDGSNIHRLTSSAGDDFGPSWSPDGTQIIFGSNRDGHYQIYMMNADGSNQRNISNNSYNDFPSTVPLTPSGSTMVFYSDRGGNRQVYTMDTNGNNVHQLTSGSLERFIPNWSSDGSKIGFGQIESNGDQQIYIMNPDGSNIQQLTSTVGTKNFDPVWTPDGTKIAFNRYPPEGGADIFTMNPDGTNQTSFTHTYSQNNSNPSWSPDGTKMFITSYRNGETQAFRINSDGTNTVQLTQINANSPSLRPVAVAPALVTAINVGGDVQVSFSADTDFSGGTSYSSSNTVDMSGVSNPAPEAVYQTVRYGNFTYTLPGLTANANYTLRLHFNELYWTSAGSRVFNVSVNSQSALTNYDIFAASGGANKAIVEQIPTTADTNGNIAVQFTTVTDNAMVNGIELYSGTLPSPTPTPTPTPASSISINTGGSTIGNFLSDTDFSGGTQYSSSAIVDTSAVASPAAEAVYQSVRYGNFTYTIPNLFPNSTYNVKLHFNELYWGTDLAGGNGGIGSRVFNTSINGTEVLSNYDIFQDAGGANKAVERQFTTTSDANGKITIVFTTVNDNAMVNGIEISQ